ncbi:hypothetical protein 1 [Beihai sea slater virus 3]|uniref:hypothetical protein 1 n=1 Tax=Beihai sea slater virus 3 TaxID=1922659 RepID=UPI00090B5280|nr:hypothetical protein 1 [Beihai sea slater virus 3]APG75987.1 hypothetical protein 1 [Beihai sea slater virus 3]
MDGFFNPSSSRGHRGGSGRRRCSAWKQARTQSRRGRASRPGRDNGSDAILRPKSKSFKHASNASIPRRLEQCIRNTIEHSRFGQRKENKIRFQPAGVEGASGLGVERLTQAEIDARAERCYCRDESGTESDSEPAIIDFEPSSPGTGGDIPGFECAGERSSPNPPNIDPEPTSSGSATEPSSGQLSPNTKRALDNLLSCIQVSSFPPSTASLAAYLKECVESRDSNTKASS